MFYNYLPIRKIVKTLRRQPKSNSRHEHERTPSLAECLDRPLETRRESWRLWIILMFIFPTIYYIFDLIAFEKSRFINRNVKNARYLYDNNVAKVMQKIDNTINAVTTVKYENDLTTHTPANLPICILNNSHLGNFLVKRLPRGISLDNQYPIISRGGYYSPVGCRSRHKVGILVPYRDREKNLAIFLYNIHPFLMKQKLEYRVFVVEQYGTDTFNKGRLFNAGYKEMKKYGKWECIVFHDLDLIPLDERILYSCPSWPRHMCGTVVEKVDDPSYHTLFGGVTSMTPIQYEKVNGYSNLYWGWGGEDHDMFWRLRFAGFPITRYNKMIAKYTSLPHPLSLRNPLRYTHLRGGLGKYRHDGLSTLEYKLISVTEKHLYTHILVDINPYNEKTTQR